MKTQIWIAVSIHVLVAIARKRRGLERSLLVASDFCLRTAADMNESQVQPDHCAHTGIGYRSYNCDIQRGERSIAASLAISGIRTIDFAAVCGVAARGSANEGGGRRNDRGCLLPRLF